MAHGPSTWTARARGRFRDQVQRLSETLGGEARARAVVLLAATLALDSADKGAIGAVAVQLEHGLHVGNTQLGLIVTVSAVVGAIVTVPIGALTDRYTRSRLLWGSILLWAAAEAAGGLAPTFGVLLATRVALGAVTGTAGPTVASLTGDLFEQGERSRMYGFILTGEFVGTGLGILVAEFSTALFGWRAAFFTLAVPSVLLAFAIRRWLPEPPRGASTRRAIDDPKAEAQRYFVVDLVSGQQVEPDGRNVMAGTGDDMGLWEAVRYVLRVRTNVILILASSLGYFFFSGLGTFAVIYVRGRYHTQQAGATAILLAVGIGALAGLVIAGQSGDVLLRRGHVDGRILVGVVGYTSAAVLLVPAFASRWLGISLPLFIVAGACVAAPNPALDAARLDVVPARLWGRAEGVRTLVRQAFQAFAPLLFGILSATLGSGRSPGSGVGIDNSGGVSTAQTRGLEFTFLIMIVPLLAAGLVLLRARATYPVDVASAAASDEAASQRLEPQAATDRRTGAG
jgi:predicted MFS family arabinose efflux permease